MILLEMRLATNKVVGSMISNPKQQEANQSVIHERGRGDRMIDLVSRAELESCISRQRVRRAHHSISTTLPLYSGTNTSVVNIRSLWHGILAFFVVVVFFFLHEAAAIFVLLSSQALCPGSALQLVPNSLLFSAPKNVDIQLCCHFMYKYILFL